MAGPLAVARLARIARRAYPLARTAYRRWERLSPEEKERYKRQARQYAERGRDAGRKAVEQAKVRRGRRR
jgi:hypothetical protein